MEKNRKKELIEQYKRTKPQMGAFAISCKQNSKCYIQATQDLHGVMNGALARLNGGMHPFRELQKEWSEYGADSFTMEVLETLEYDKDESKTDYTEELALLQMIWEERITQDGKELYRKRL